MEVAVLYGSQPARRRDAQRNRSAILRAATEAMTSQRTVIGMPEIARRAGIGQATLYRHFPDRLALAAAVITDRIDQLERCVTAGKTFRQALDEMLHAQITMRPLVQLARRLDPGLRRRYLRRITAVLTEPLRRAQRQGLVRADLVPGDLVLLLNMVEGVVEGSGTTAAGRSIELALDGVFRPVSSPSDAAVPIGKL